MPAREMQNNETPQAASGELHSAIDEALQLFLRVDDARTTVRPGPGKWCAREVLGHLIDSACNNHRRFITGQSPDTTKFEGYKQDEWVSRQRYHDVPWHELVALWAAYNRHLAHIMSSTSPEAAAGSATSPDGSGQVTVAFLMVDYVQHLRHHLEQIRRLLSPP
jgi:DinB family protein